jgi:hypothetical protein
LKSVTDEDKCAADSITSSRGNDAENDEEEREEIHGIWRFECEAFCHDSVKAHTREEGHSGEIIATVVDSHPPLTFLLKYTLATTSVCFKNSIQARFGGGSLPTTIKQLNPSFTDASNQIAVEIHIRNEGAGNNFGVVKFEINAVSDGVIHQGFNLAHFESLERWEASAPLDLFNIGHHGALWGFGGQCVRWHNISLLCHPMMR